MIKIAIIEKQVLFVDALKGILQKNGAFQVVATIFDYTKVPAIYETHCPDVILMEFDPNDTEIIDTIAKLITDFPNVKVVILTTHNTEPNVARWMRKGIHGYLLKDMDAESIICAIQGVVSGDAYIHPRAAAHLLKDYKHLAEKEHEGYFIQNDIRKPYHLLTQRECEILQLLTDGNSNMGIAEKLFISDKTVKNHVSKILTKMKVNDRTNAVVTAIKNGWVEVK